MERKSLKTLLKTDQEFYEVSDVGAHRWNYAEPGWVDQEKNKWADFVRGTQANEWEQIFEVSPGKP